MSENSSPIAKSHLENLISEQEDQGIMDIPTASLHSNASATHAAKAEASHNSSNISDNEGRASPNFSRTTMSVHSSKSASLISDNSPKPQNTAIYDVSASKSAKTSYLSRKEDRSAGAAAFYEKTSGNTNVASISNQVENAFSPNYNTKSDVSRSDSPISLISNKVSNPPLIEAQETSILSRNEGVISTQVRTVEHQALKDVDSRSNLISAHSSGYNAFYQRSANASTSLMSRSSTLDTSNSTYYNREPAYFLANDVKPERVDLSGDLKFAQIAAHESRQTPARQAPPVPPRPGKRTVDYLKFRPLLPGELPFAEMVQGGFQRQKEDQKCWVSSRLTDLLNQITVSIIQLTGRCE